VEPSRQCGWGGGWRAARATPRSSVRTRSKRAGKGLQLGEVRRAA
jgi:hypothetical protein